MDRGKQLSDRLAQSFGNMKCISGNKAAVFCMRRKCEESILLCQTQGCQCLKKHKKCDEWQKESILDFCQFVRCSEKYGAIVENVKEAHGQLIDAFEEVSGEIELENNDRKSLQNLDKISSETLEKEQAEAIKNLWQFKTSEKMTSLTLEAVKAQKKIKQSLYSTQYIMKLEQPINQPLQKEIQTQTEEDQQYKSQKSTQLGSKLYINDNIVSRKMSKQLKLQLVSLKIDRVITNQKDLIQKQKMQSKLSQSSKQEEKEDESKPSKTQLYIQHKDPVKEEQKYSQPPSSSKKEQQKDKPQPKKRYPNNQQQAKHMAKTYMQPRSSFVPFKMTSHQFDKSNRVQGMKVEQPSQ